MTRAIGVTGAVNKVKVQLISNEGREVTQVENVPIKRDRRGSGKALEINGVEIKKI